MTHLEEMKMTYWGHLRLASLNSMRLLWASIVLFVHGCFPSIFTKSASKLLDSVRKSFPTGEQDRILVRFNTKWQNDPQKRQWRVLVNGVEALAHKVDIRTASETIEEEIAGEQKFHFLCFGKTVWYDTNVQII